MKKLFFVIPLVFSGFLLNSYGDNIPHIEPAAGCPIGQICCPTAVYCSYLTGCGDSEGWTVEGNISSFEGVKAFPLTKISAKNGFLNYQGKMVYQIASCTYMSDSSAGNLINLVEESARNAFLLNGSWVYGFMKDSAICSTYNSTDCTFTSVS